MVKIRFSVFETNSSSCHALVTGEDEIFKEFVEGHAIWVPYGLEDVPIELAQKCFLRGRQEAEIEYCYEEHAAVFILLSDIRDWAKSLPEDDPYHVLSYLESDWDTSCKIMEIHAKLNDDFNGPGPHTWLSSSETSPIMSGNIFRMEHNWNTWD